MVTDAEEDCMEEVLQQARLLADPASLVVASDPSDVAASSTPGFSVGSLARVAATLARSLAGSAPVHGSAPLSGSTPPGGSAPSSGSAPPSVLALDSATSQRPSVSWADMVEKAIKRSLVPGTSGLTASAVALAASAGEVLEHMEVSEEGTSRKRLRSRRSRRGAAAPVPLTPTRDEEKSWLVKGKRRQLNAPIPPPSQVKAPPPPAMPVPEVPLGDLRNKALNL